MDILKDKQTRQYDYISRYAGFPFYYNTQDNKYIYGLTNQLSQNVRYVTHTVKQSDTLDYLANYYYGRPDYFWVIADFNRIQDPFITLWKNYNVIKVPSLADVYYER